MNVPASPPSSPTEPEPISHETGRSKQKNFPWTTVIFLAIGALVVAIFASVLAWPHLSRIWNRRQALALLEKADAALKDQQWQAASENYSKAYLEAPGEPEVLRGIANFMQKTGADPERTLTFWRQLSEISTPSVQDRLDMAKSYIQLEKAAEARDLLNTLSPQERTASSALEIEASILNIEGRTAEAASTLRHAMRLDPNNPQSQLKLALLDLRNPLTEVQNVAIDQLWALARGTTDASLSAIETLARETRLTQKDFAELITLLKNNARAEPRHRYAVLGQMLQRQPEQRQAFYEQEEAKLDPLPPNERIPYLLMLQSLGEHERVLKQIPMDRALKLREFFSLYAESLAATGQWAALREGLRRSPSLPIAPTDLALLNARISKGLSESEDVIRGHLLDAARFATANRDIRNVRRVSAVADSMGYPTAALEALRSGASLPQHRVVMLEAVLSIQTNQQDAEGMLKTLTDLVQADPSLHYHHEKQLYLKLLLGLDLELIPKTLADPKVTEPLAPAVRKLLAALSAYRQQNIDDLRAALVDISPEYFSPGQRAVLSGLLNVSGNARRGFEIAEKVPDSLLLESERKFLRRAL